MNAQLSLLVWLYDIEWNNYNLHVLLLYKGKVLFMAIIRICMQASYFFTLFMSNVYHLFELVTQEAIAKMVIIYEQKFATK